MHKSYGGESEALSLGSPGKKPGVESVQGEGSPENIRLFGNDFLPGLWDKEGCLLWASCLS